jgi:hypothetical protein
MTGFSSLTEYASSVAAFFLSADQRLLALRDTIQTTAEDEDATPSDKMLANGLGLWLDAVDFWVGLIPFHGATGLPTLAIVSPLASAGDVTGSVTITPPGLGALLAITPIVRVGGTETLAADDPVLSPDRRTLSLTVEVPEPPTPPTPPTAVAGLYQGLIYALPQTPVANVQVVLTE